MNRNKLLATLIFFLIFIYGLDQIGQELYLNYATWWFDMIMHFLGGFWQGLLFIWFFSIKDIPFLYPSLDSKDPYLPHKTIFFVLLIGFLWEVFEFYANNYIGIYAFDIRDTLSDLFFDLLGGSFAIFFYYKSIMHNDQNRVQ